MSNDHNTDDFAATQDALNNLNFMARHLELLAELFGHGVEEGGYPTLVSENSRHGMFLSLQNAAKVIEKSADILDRKLLRLANY